MLVLIDKQENKKRIGGSPSGYCDGNKVYYYDDNFSKYSEILLFGHYWTFSDYFEGSSYGSVYSPGFNGSPGMMVSTGSSNSKFTDYIFDITNGRVLKLTVGNLKKHILVDDPELLAAFIKETEPKLMLNQYVRKYNDRNPTSF
jgi:hypothetical protein